MRFSARAAAARADSAEARAKAADGKLAEARAALAELASLDNVRIMPRTTVFGVYDHGVYGALEQVTDHLATPPAHLPRQRMWKVRAQQVIIAQGAHERPLVFAGNDIQKIFNN